VAIKEYLAAELVLMLTLNIRRDQLRVGVKMRDIALYLNPKHIYAETIKGQVYAGSFLLD
jgi:hypothetical protein